MLLLHEVADVGLEESFRVGLPELAVLLAKLLELDVDPMELPLDVLLDPFAADPLQSGLPVEVPINFELLHLGQQPHVLLFSYLQTPL